ncbi:hypothetical protein K2224_17465 [Streptomyces sp. BHT-5-2]|uniref:hypothetical protein n=1 Tax=unclassified Streptomyces TaxID=2593676 RepID=UPI001C8D3339|nr:hypothetical protein [Streptomyces sp. BHT-5-2]QZL04716.1 hypothetical protein K2224_17465 [Streptomyces sp. BHT-5-2]
MSVFTAVHIRRTGTAIHGRNPGRSILDALATAARRIADSPLDNAVLHTLPGPTTVPESTTEERPARPHAHWHTVPGPQGRRRLEAHWHVTP